MRVLHIEDDAGESILLQEALRDAGSAVKIEYVRAQSLGTGLAHLRGSRRFDVVLLDLGLADSTGLATLHAVREAYPDLPTVVLTGLDDEPSALAALRDGAQDYLVKSRIDGVALHRVLVNSIERAGIQARLRNERRRSRRPDGAGRVRLVHTDPHEHSAALADHVRRLAAGGGMIVLVCFERGHEVLREELHRSGVKTSCIVFLDIAGPRSEHAASGVFQLGPAKSPERLDDVGMQIESACGQLGSESQVIIDSLNPIMRVTNPTAALRFLQFVGNRMRALGIGIDFIVQDDAAGRGLATAATGMVDSVMTAAAPPGSLGGRVVPKSR